MKDYHDIHYQLEDHRKVSCTTRVFLYQRELKLGLKRGYKWCFEINKGKRSCFGRSFVI